MARRVGTLSFRSEALYPTELGGILDQAFDIAIRPGLHCAPYIHRSIGTFPEGTVRVSPGPFSTEEDIDRFALEAAVPAFVPPAGAAPRASGMFTGLLCPDCGGELIFSSACLICPTCGYTRC